MRGMTAFILAGGVGKRLSLLTNHRAKPAVPFAGKYRIIDFTLTNCVRSGISDVYILTQYISRSLIRHLGIGKPWDLDRFKGGLHILHPRLGYEGADWYQGTADALFQNISVLKNIDTEHVLILSGDHVYRMDYNGFLEYHLEAGKPASLGVVPVPSSMCREFGIATIDDSGGIVRFDEKPERSESNLASMGIYIFKRKYLISVLKNYKQMHQDLDFGKHIIPDLVRLGEISAYRHKGYWLDIGTLKSYYNASLGLLGENPRIKLGKAGETILTVPDDNPPLLMMRGASISTSLVCNGCLIKGRVAGSILSPNVIVEEGAEIVDSIILHGCRIGRAARLKSVIMDKFSTVGRNTSIGFGDAGIKNAIQPGYLDFGITLVGRKTQIPSGMSIGTNCLVSGENRKSTIPSRDLGDGESCLPAGLVLQG